MGTKLYLWQVTQSTGQFESPVFTLNVHMCVIELEWSMGKYFNLSQRSKIDLTSERD
jgi:hypothetical protein